MFIEFNLESPLLLRCILSYLFKDNRIENCFERKVRILFYFTIR